MSAPRFTEKKNGNCPCLLNKSEWSVCYENNCYQNYQCPAFKGKYPSPIRDYIPLPPVFILVEPLQAIPYYYQIHIANTDPDDIY